MSRCYDTSIVRSSRPAALSSLMDYGDSDSEDSDTMDVDIDVERVAEKRRRSVSPEPTQNGCGESQSKRAALPLPSSVREMFGCSGGAQEQGPADDPVLHEGRTRNFAHVRGNWATYVCIPFEASPVFDSLVSSCLAICQSSVPSIVAQKEFHISLTRTVVLKHHWINEFVANVRQAMERHRRFRLSLGGVRAYVNDEKTRTFLGLTVTAGLPDVAAVSATLDKCLAEYNLPPFYQEGSFHLSVAWCTGDESAAITRLIPQLNTAVGEFATLDDVTLTCDVSEVHCHCGNKEFQVPLSSA